MKHFEMYCLALHKLLCTQCFTLPFGATCPSNDCNTTQPATYKCNALYICQAVNALLVFLQKMEVGGGRKPQDRHIGIRSHLSAWASSTSRRHVNLTLGVK